MAISKEGRLKIWLAGGAAFLVLLYLLRSILLPFVAGMAVAYFLDPIVQRMLRAGMSRTLATVLITLGFFILVVTLFVLIAPVLEHQVVAFAQKVPDYVQALINRGQPLWKTAKAYLSPSDIERLRSAASGYAGTLAGWTGAFFKSVLTGSLVVVNILSLVFITPVVTFYMLRDWHKITDRVGNWLPRHHAETIRAQLKEIDIILSGFVRGQALLCLTLGAFYGLGLTVVGLDLGLVVGFSAGMLSFIPYLGSTTGFLIGVGLALAQSPDWTLPLMVGCVFLVGNLLEGNVLSPKLVGEKIGLHPVWVIFALLAGGALFGFLGILLALPVAAVIGVLTRFSLERYLISSLYTGDKPEGTAP
ncbi:MAG TPA: AI-2E family transporter [Candidatus Sulfotelmatobacter sp.]|jgi:predicted PurR-regulated permease PerM|nr:AI-2E family transporter [Candidatus Sulfotelmatobacter sp.]